MLATAAPPSPDDPYLNRVLDKKYRIDQLLGVGGMGRVYKATQLSLDKVVCIKVLRQGTAPDETLVGRFHREARASSRLSHPNSIAVTDFGQAAEDGSLYMAMEYIPGKDLGKIIKEEHPLSEARTVHFMDQVLSALADAHAAGIVHRDLKPENIMVTDLRGTKDFVKVLDFGIAKLKESSSAEAGLTQMGMVCGTPEYMSPEQARGEELDARSDIYSAGVILYHLVVGRIPFEAPTAMAIVTKHLIEPVLAPSKISGVKVSAAMEAAILKALSKDRNGRQPSALSFQQELAQVLHPMTAPAQEGALSGNLFDEEPARPAHATSAKAAASPGAPGSPAGSGALPAPPRSRPWLMPVAVGVGVLVVGLAVGIPLFRAKKAASVPAPQAAPSASGPAAPAKAAAPPAAQPAPAPAPATEAAPAAAPAVPALPDTVSEAARMHYLAGKEFMVQNKLEKALEAFELAVRKSPDFAAVYKAMGMCHMRLGNIKEAKKNISLYLTKAPEGEDRKEMEEFLRSL